MNEYLAVKWIHVVSSTVLFGTGIGSAFYMLLSSLGGDVRVTARVARYVVLADWLFTTPTAIVQPLTGLYLVYLAKIPMDSSWVARSLALYGLALACWLPVVWVQMKMRDLAGMADEQNLPLPRRYRQYLTIWVALGTIALIAFIAIFYLMIFKPV